jgi:hypothetical protein
MSRRDVKYLTENNVIMAGKSAAILLCAIILLCGLRDKTMKRNEVIQQKAKREAEKVMKIIGPLRQTGQTLATIAGTLNDMEVATSRGGQWTPMQVKRVLERVAS